MKKLLVLLILLAVLTAGCSGLFNLNGWVVPDDDEFFALIQELDTPEKICQYMYDDFAFELYISNPLSPYQFYITKRGDCDDFATFAQFIADYHSYEVYKVYISYKNFVTHVIAIYKENGFYNFSDNQYYFSVEATNFEKVVDYKSNYLNFKKWLRYVVYDYDMNIIEQGGI